MAGPGAEADPNSSFCQQEIIMNTNKQHLMDTVKWCREFWFAGESEVRNISLAKPLDSTIVFIMFLELNRMNNDEMARERHLKMIEAGELLTEKLTTILKHAENGYKIQLETDYHAYGLLKSVLTEVGLPDMLTVPTKSMTTITKNVDQGVDNYAIEYKLGYRGWSDKIVKNGKIE